ncbi:Signal transduction histidine kinase [Amycolatopsis arida]|uniref:histidine kinase n=1 Tax=Amycolatopsis arida TaxID=587909 RepID=A0A1I5QW39_9PSEU|nr:sensor histidine kinase [Amycolatopsis arida]TDX98983.1 signal transduction histidine kinase [Amycolatopsis arida]SFP50452.1 Signal transduction histidine kinase [Amycolatopsis arida]
MRLPLSPRAVDVWVAVAVAAGIVAGTWFSATFGGEQGELGPLAWALMLGAPALLVLRRRFPVLVAVGTLVAAGLYYPLVAPDGPIMLAFVVALYIASAEGYLVPAAILAAVALLAMGYGEVVGGVRHVDNPGMVMLAGWLVATIALGGVRRTRLSYLGELERRAATEERLHIARELHDVLGHHLSMINVQAGAALHRFGKDPAQAERALDAIKQASGQTLRELRGTLGVLRQTEPEGPGLARLDELFERARAAGLRVDAQVEGERAPVPDEVDLTAYRVVQEALTNVARHAEASTVTVRVRHGRRELRVEVADDGRGGQVWPGKGLPGHGIRGMAERVRALGGELEVGGRRGGGFRVDARLPVGAAVRNGVAG